MVRDTAENDKKPNEFGPPGAALLPTTARSKDAVNFAGDIAAVSEAKFRTLDFANRIRTPKYNMGFRSRQKIRTG